MGDNNELSWAQFEMLNQFHTLCKTFQVSYSLNFEECPNTFYLVISSSVPSEGLVTKSLGSLEAVLKSGIKYLQSKNTF